MNFLEKSESTYERRFKKGVEALGGMCIKFPAVWISGFPDRLVFLPGGHFRLVEHKKPTGRKSGLQKYVHKQLLKLGFPVALLWNDEDVTNELLEYKKLCYNQKDV